MRSIILISFIIPLSVNAQKFALIDKKLKWPILYSDSITVEQIKRGFFPIENKGIDTLVANINYLKGVLDVRQRSKMQSFELKSSNVTIKTTRVPFAYGDRYSSIMVSQNKNASTELILLNAQSSNKKNSKALSNILEYLKSNKSYYTSPYEITPRLYNIVVIMEK